MWKIIMTILALAVIAGSVVTITNKQGSKDNKDNTVAINNDSKQAKSKSACELLTLADAKSLIGENATLSEDSSPPNLATTQDVDIDNCTYSADGATLGDLKQITLQRHFGDTSQVKQAYTNYQKQYPGEAVAGLGDMAYYATEAKQIQVLKADYWLYLAGGSINAGDAANRELEVKAAQIALAKL